MGKMTMRTAVMKEEQSRASERSTSSRRSKNGQSTTHASSKPTSPSAKKTMVGTKSESPLADRASSAVKGDVSP